MKDELLYLISGRNTYSDQLSRKFFEMNKCFSQIIKTRVLSGGDFQRKDRTSYHHLTQAEYHAKWYRKNRLFRGLAESYGELRSIRHNFQTYRYLKKEGEVFRLIWERSTGLHWAGILYARKMGIPSVLEWKDHLIKEYWSLFRPLVRYVEKWKNKHSDYIVVESMVLKNQLVSSGVDPNKVFVTYNAVNPEEFTPNTTSRSEYRRKFGFLDSDLVVGYVGSYAFYHDSIRMIKAADVIVSKGIKNIKWLLVGDGKDKEICAEYARQKGLLRSSVFMMGSVPKEQVPHLLSAVDITILPGSTDIICPIKVMEYMAMGDVVLVPDYPCNREIVDGKTNGLLFKPFDENSIADQLLYIFSNRGVIENMGRNAREYVCDKLTWDKTFGAALRLILEKTA